MKLIQKFKNWKKKKSWINLTLKVICLWKLFCFTPMSFLRTFFHQYIFRFFSKESYASLSLLPLLNIHRMHIHASKICLKTAKKNTKKEEKNRKMKKSKRNEKITKIIMFHQYFGGYIQNRPTKKILCILHKISLNILYPFSMWKQQQI